jgi:maleate isomerase
MPSPRIGLMIPSSNTVMEADFQRVFGGRATIHTARMFLPDPVTADDELRMLDEFAAPAARDVGSVEPQVVVFGCTSAGALRGAESDARLRDELATAADAPVIGVFDTIGLSLERLGCRRVAVVTPYVDELNDVIVKGMEAQGFDVTIAGMGLADNIAIGRVEPAEILEFVVANTPDDAEAVAIPCTNFRSFEVREELQQRLGRPVVTANSSVVEAVEERLRSTQP